MIKRKCPNCGEIVESKFCTSCGHDLTGPDIIKICPKCGTETASKFCTGCGTSLIDEPAKKPDEKPEEKPVVEPTKAAPAVAAANVFQRAKKIGAKKVQELEQSAEAKKALREKEAELALEKQQREAELLREKQKREAELALEQQKREAERREAEAARVAQERERQLEKERKAAQEKEENEKKQKLIKQKRVYAEAAAYIENASKIEDHGVAAQFYRKAEELFSSIAGVEDADEKCLFAARKAKEHEIILETEKAKAEQAAREEAERIKAEEAAKAEAERIKAEEAAKAEIAKAEAERIKAEEAAKAEAAKAEAERIKAEMAAKVEAERIKAEQAGKEKTEAATVAADSAVIEGETPIHSATKDVPSISEDVNTDSVSTESPEEKPAGKSKSKLIIVIAAVAVLAVIGLIFGLSGGGSDESDLSSEETVESDEGDTGSSSGMFPMNLVSTDDLKITIDDAYYTTNASDIEFAMTVVNDKKDSVDIILENVVVDDAKVPGNGQDDPIEKGEWWISRYISFDDLSNAGVTEFSDFSCTVLVTRGGEEIEKKELKMKPDDFTEYDANISGSPVDNSEETVEISKKNLTPIIALNDRYKIAVNGCYYNPNESPYICLDIINNAKEVMYIDMEDILIDDSSLRPMYEEAEALKAGDSYYYGFVDIEDIKASGVEDFKEMSCTLVVKVGDKEELRQKVHITRDGFVEE